MTVFIMILLVMRLSVMPDTKLARKGFGSLRRFCKKKLKIYFYGKYWKACSNIGMGEEWYAI